MRVDAAAHAGGGLSTGAQLRILNSVVQQGLFSVSGRSLRQGSLRLFHSEGVFRSIERSDQLSLPNQISLPIGLGRDTTVYLRGDHRPLPGLRLPSGRDGDHHRAPNHAHAADRDGEVRRGN